MKKKLARIGYWIAGCICMAFVCVKTIKPVTEQEIINSENYLVTADLKAGDVLEQSITLQKGDLSQVAVAFVYDEMTSNTCVGLVEIISNDEVLLQERMQLITCPNGTLVPFGVNGASVGEMVTVRISNISTETDNSRFALLYTDNELRMFDNVTQYSINGQIQEGQLISRYTYNTGYEYYMALTVTFGIFLIWLALDNLLYKK